MPTDVVVATEFSAVAEADVKPVGAVGSNEMILDIGPDTAEQLSKLIAEAGTILWNGPVGVFEFDQFGEGTRIARERHRAQQGVLARRRRRYARGHREVRRRGQHLLHFHRRRRISRVRRGQEAARGGHSRAAGGVSFILRRAKIVATLGPATDDPKVLGDVVRAGVDVVRVNFSHGQLADHKRRLDLVRDAARSAGRYVGVLGDLQGPKIRVERFTAGKVQLARRRGVHSRCIARGGRGR